MTQQQLVHEQVQGFAAAGWIPGATARNRGDHWRWYQQGADKVIAGRKLTGDEVCDGIGNPDIVERFTPAQVQRICAATCGSSTTP